MSCLLVVFTQHVEIFVTVTKWHNKKDRKDTEQYPHQAQTQTKNGFRKTKKHPN